MNKRAIQRKNLKEATNRKSTTAKQVFFLFYINYFNFTVTEPVLETAEREPPG